MCECLVVTPFWLRHRWCVPVWVKIAEKVSAALRKPPSGSRGERAVQSSDARTQCAPSPEATAWSPWISMLYGRLAYRVRWYAGSNSGSPEGSTTMTMCGGGAGGGEGGGEGGGGLGGGCPGGGDGGGGEGGGGDGGGGDGGGGDGGGGEGDGGDGGGDGGGGRGRKCT